VDEITSHEQKRFRLSLGEGRLKPSTIDKIAATGRSALIHAVKHGILESAPHIFSIETPQEKEARPPLGRPLSIEEMAAFFDVIKQPHLMVFTLILANTLTRPIAALELRRNQYDHLRNIVDLNPAGRVQTKKRRPVIPVTPTLKPWLEMPISNSDTYVAYNGASISAFRGTWVNTVKRAGLDTGVTPYSFRHGMARLLRLRGIHLDDLGAFLGHRHQGARETTRIYAPDNPDQLRHVADAIEGIMEEVRKLLTHVPIQNPAAYLEWVQNQPRPHNGRLPPQRRAEMLDMIRAGRPLGEIARSFGVSKAAVAKHRKKLARKRPAPLACLQRATSDQP
jgi:integrase